MRLSYRASAVTVCVHLALCLGVAWGGEKKAPAAPAASLQDQAQARLEEYLKKSPKALAGLSAVDLASGKTLIAINDTDLYAPASNQKLLTSAFALARLGGDFKFTTSVYQSGKDLIIVGDGDPLLGDPYIAEEQKKSIYEDLDVWAARIKEQVGGEFSGQLIACSLLALKDYRHPDWPKDQYRQWYSAPVSGLNFNNNCIDVSFTVKGGVVAATASPESRFIQFANKVRLGKTSTWSLHMGPDESSASVTGTVNASSSEPQSTAIDNPPLLLARVLADRMERAGVKFSGTLGQAHAVDVSKAALLCQTRTPLAAAMRRANKRSLNMVAECIFLRSGDGTWEGSATLAGQTLAQAYGVPAEQVLIRDGSGLSHDNRVAPAAMTKMLSDVARHKDAAIFLVSLPISGTDGTLEERLAKAPYRGRVLGKTGYIAGVSSLSGFVLDTAGKPAIAFSVLVNKVPKGYEAKAMQDDICKLLVDWLAK